MKKLAEVMAANALFVIALCGLILLTGGVALKLDAPSAAIVAGSLLLLSAIYGVKNATRSRNA